MAVIDRLFTGYAEALAECGTGYEDDLLARVVAHKTLNAVQDVAPEQVINVVAAVGVAASALATGRPLRVLDFGGACGVHFLRASPVIDYPLRWSIVETAAMARQARDVAAGRFDAFSSLEDAVAWLGTAVDLVFTSGAIQYVPDPIGALRQLAALRAPYLALARLPVWHGEETVGIQESRLSHNGIGPMLPGVEDRDVRTPVTFSPLEQVFDALGGYERIFQMAAPSATYEVAGTAALGMTMIFRRQL